MPHRKTKGNGEWGEEEAKRMEAAAGLQQELLQKFSQLLRSLLISTIEDEY